MRAPLTIASLLWLAAANLACGSDSTEPAPEPPPDPPPVDTSCRAGERPLEDGTCLPAGVSDCGDGFASDGATGCVATLPAAACPPGQIAVPGDEACREVMPCGAEPWGDIPVEPSTIYVDAAAGSGGDGSAGAPLSSLPAAVSAAGPDGMIALASGSYSGVAPSSPVRIWGRCPAMVTLDGGGAEALSTSASGVELHGVTLTSGLAGAVVFGGGLWLDRVVITATGEAGLRLFDGPGPAVVQLTGSLIEGSTRYGIWMAGSELTMTDSVVRGLVAGPHPFSQALAVQPSLDGVPSIATVQRSVFAQNEDVAVAVFGSTATLEGVVIRDTVPRSSDGDHGRGLVAQDAPMTGRATLTVTGGVIERNQEVSVFLAGSDVSLDQLTVRDTRLGGLGAFGRGVDLEASYIDGQASTLVMTQSSVAQSIGSGVLVLGSQATLESVAVTGVQALPGSQLFGVGIGLQDSLEWGTLAAMSSSWGRVAEVQESGVAVTNSDVQLLAMLVEDVTSSGAGFGDGFSITSRSQPTFITMDGSEATRIERAGVAAFGAGASLADNLFGCTAIDIAISDFEGNETSLEDRGGNLCGCEPEAFETCKALSSTIEAPDPLDPLE